MRSWLVDRWLHLGILVAIGVAIVGFFTGTRGSPRSSLSHLPDETEESTGEHERAPRHADLAGRHSANRLRHGENLAAMRADRPALTDPVTRDPEAWAAALKQRESRRAYAGAPPVIPHPIDQRSSHACDTCHEQGMRVAGHTAPARSHEELQSCIECHVVADGPVPRAEPPPSAGPPFADNSFEGLGSAGDGPRAWPGAPPQIPHRTTLRERCASCHGVLGGGLRTTHPWRQACTQCHTPSAAQNRRPTANLGPSPGDTDGSHPNAESKP